MKGEKFVERVTLFQLLIIFILGVLQVVIVQKEHQLKVSYYNNLKTLEEEKHLLNLMKIELYKNTNDCKVIEFFKDRDFKLIQ